MQEVQAKNRDGQIVYCTTLRTDLDVPEAFSDRDLSRGYGVSSEIVHDVAHEWTLNCPLPPTLLNEALKQLFKTNFPFPPAACIDHRYRATTFFDDQKICYMLELAWLQVIGAKLEELRGHYGDRRRCE